MKNILIVGAGLCGSLLAIRLAQRGLRVTVCEKRPDPRISGHAGGRSINLALSNRGWRALAAADMENVIRPLCIPMTGRMIHPLHAEALSAPYSGRSGEYINSVSRGGLNVALLERAATYPNLSLHFDCEATGVNLEKGTADFFNHATGQKMHFEADAVFGTDGAGSVVRRSMMARTNDLLFNYSQNFLRHGYKELRMPPTPDGGFALNKNALHIWPRGTYMVIALPNLDGSFTVTVFLPFRGDAGFHALHEAEKAMAFFKEQFPEVLPLIPDFADEWMQNPTGTLGTIKCYPWQAYGKALLLGDAAHAVVPFYGQGMNASFEDVTILDEMIEKMGLDDLNALFEAFQDARKPDADAIADLATDNFYEMRDHVANPVFQRKRQLETLLEYQQPGYFSKYSLVTFREDVPYRYAMHRGRLQDDWLMTYCAQHEDSAWNLDTVWHALQQMEA